MRNKMLKWIGIVIFSGLAFAFIQCENSFIENQPADELTVSMRNDKTIDIEGILQVSDAEKMAELCACLVSDLDPVSLTEAEKNAILFMREEEKMARDIYVKLYEEWSMPIFGNIAAAEKRHMDAVLCLITKYAEELPGDPVGGNPAGVFANAEIQQLHDQLLAKGMESLEDALRVGAMIEDRDIADLKNALEVTANEDILTIFGALLKGSYNHLRAFTTLLANMDVTFTPQFLTAEDLAVIVGSSWNRGGLTCLTCPVCKGTCDDTCPGCDGVCPVCDGVCDGVCPNYDGVCPHGDGVCDGTCPGCSGTCSGTCVYTCSRLRNGACIGNCGKVVGPCHRFMMNKWYKKGQPPYGNAYGQQNRNQNRGKKR